MKSVVKFMLFIPETAIGTTVRAPIPAISHFDILGFKQKTEKRFQKF